MSLLSRNKFCYVVCVLVSDIVRASGFWNNYVCVWCQAFHMRVCVCVCVCLFISFGFDP